MYIALYISSHGFGHMTRCLSLIENILKNTQYNIYIACGKKQNDFARIYLSKYESRIMYKDLVTDIGLINKKNTLEVDTEKLENKLVEFVSSWDDVVNKEVEELKKLNIKSIVCDISPIGCLVGKKLNLPTTFISNFTWIEQYEHLGIDEDLINKFRTAYSNINKFIQYDLCLAKDYINSNEVYDGGFVCREIDKLKVDEIKAKYGKSIFITCGKSASLNCINIKNFSGTIFTTSGIDITTDKECNIVKLPIDILDTQNYIAASDIVISKAGWGTIAEAIIGHTNLVLIDRPSAKEDTFNIEKIKENKLGISIKEQDLTNIDIQEIKNRLNNNIDYNKLNKYKNNVKKVVDIILN